VRQCGCQSSFTVLTWGVSSMHYTAPLDEMIFVLSALTDVERVSTLSEFGGQAFDAASLRDILQPAAQLAGEKVAPSNRSGDAQGATLSDGRVSVPNDVAEALREIMQGGWIGLSLPTAVGGFGLPECIGTAVMEMWNSANMALALNPMLTIGAALALIAHADAEQIARYVPNMVSGAWSGTMNLTEPDAGSDLGRIKTQALRNGDHYLLRGQKIFITWGEHDVAANIVHLVLARTPDAPAGTRGISLFIVPKFLVNADGSLGARNDVSCVSLEHKLGIHASPTCVLVFGDNSERGDGAGAIGYLVGEENHGLAYLFTMMNEARLKVGLQGLAIAEGAHQQALAYARERVQGNDRSGQPLALVQHADVQRMLLTQRALIQAMRALAYVEAVTVDVARHVPEPDIKQRAQRRVDLLVPVIKGWLTEVGQEIANLGVQIHGGMGFIEETGAAQWLRDGRIAAIYEGTNGIQALDLLTRKLVRDQGLALRELVEAMMATSASLRNTGDAHRRQAELLDVACAQLVESAEHLLQRHTVDAHGAQAGAFDFMMQLGYVYGAWQSLRILQVLDGDAGSAAIARGVAAQFYFERILPRAQQHQQALHGDSSAWSAAALLV
jgi:alkylation response protein AidB-like acyl-CoA dehydrogenase